MHERMYWLSQVIWALVLWNTRNCQHRKTTCSKLHEKHLHCSFEEIHSVEYKTFHHTVSLLQYLSRFWNLKELHTIFVHVFGSRLLLCPSAHLHKQLMCTVQLLPRFRLKHSLFFILLSLLFSWYASVCVILGSVCPACVRFCHS